MEALLVWLGNYEVYLCGDKDVVHFEQLVFEVREYNVDHSKQHWSVEIEAWSVWEQEPVTIRFQLLDAAPSPEDQPAN